VAWDSREMGDRGGGKRRRKGEDLEVVWKRREAKGILDVVFRDEVCPPDFE